MLKIGFSPCFNHADPARPLFKGKTLLYAEMSLMHWVEESGAFPILIPTLSAGGKITLRQVVEELDGLVLQGGDDVSPLHYGEEPLQPKWKGDSVRDEYEMVLIREFNRQKKPILGICRGLQILNVALGGSLYQDIPTQVPGSLVHRNWEIYDRNGHDTQLAEGGKLSKMFGGKTVVRTNSVHHQAILKLAPGLVVEATSPADGIVEAVRHESADFLWAVQWHPEFHDADPEFIDTRPLLEAFLKAAKARQKKK